MLLQSLKAFEGTIAIVSHDRHFLKELATRVFEIDHGQMRVYEGKYTEYLDRVSAHH